MILSSFPFKIFSKSPVNSFLTPGVFLTVWFNFSIFADFPDNSVINFFLFASAAVRNYALHDFNPLEFTETYLGAQNQGCPTHSLWATCSPGWL